MTKHYDVGTINDLCGGPAALYGKAVVVLNSGDTAWNPASTKGDIYGPRKLRYFKDPCGWHVQVAAIDSTDF